LAQENLLIFRTNEKMAFQGMPVAGLRTSLWAVGQELQNKLQNPVSRKQPPRQGHLSSKNEKAEVCDQVLLARSASASSQTHLALMLQGLGDYGEVWSP
jgi:hypothetical protein